MDSEDPVMNSVDPVLDSVFPILDSAGRALDSTGPVLDLVDISTLDAVDNFILDLTGNMASSFTYNSVSDMENKDCSSSGQTFLDNLRFASIYSVLSLLEDAPWTTSNHKSVDKTVSESVGNTIYELAHNIANANDLKDNIYTPRLMVPVILAKLPDIFKPPVLLLINFVNQFVIYGTLASTLVTVLFWKHLFPLLMSKEFPERVWGM